jgi:hypothetical protein
MRIMRKKHLGCFLGYLTQDLVGKVTDILVTKSCKINLYWKEVWKENIYPEVFKFYCCGEL